MARASRAQGVQKLRMLAHKARERGMQLTITSARLNGRRWSVKENVGWNFFLFFNFLNSTEDLPMIEGFAGETLVDFPFLKVFIFGICLDFLEEFQKRKN